MAMLLRTSACPRGSLQDRLVPRARLKPPCRSVASDLAAPLPIALACLAAWQRREELRRRGRRHRLALGCVGSSAEAQTKRESEEPETNEDIAAKLFAKLDPADILGDGSILKGIIEEGSDPPIYPILGDECLCHFVGTLPDGKVFNDTLKRDQPFKFALGAEHVLEGFDEGVATMRKGERAVFKLSPDVAYGSTGARDEKDWQVPPDTPVTFDIRLLDVIKPEEQDRGYGSEDVGAGGSDPDGRYTWERKGTEVLVTLPVMRDTVTKDIGYAFKERSVFITVRGEVLLDGVPGCELNYEECFWELVEHADGQKLLLVHLQKKGALSARWPETLLK
eukprot:TRINITY_DN94519_c0_g1_i1.p1 TRINITY_DN94519_c0_g1~~TRINITY_DN94519_c0_g1_i1.p1  ORF type:complete len:346 (-),score=44.99 TRINITY_DN94519_c0_g1_i1:69-1076(-)